MGLKRVKERRSDALAGEDWARVEQLLADYYRGEGYVVEHCGTGGRSARFDGGVDLRLRRDGELQSPLLETPLEPVDVATLSPKARAALQSVDQHLNWERSRPLDKPPKPIATWALAATLLVVFLLGIPGGTTDQENLVNMGALILPQELRPGAWRLVSAGFVHFGATHLALNLLALLLVGGALERLWGRLTLLGSFLGGSIGAYWLATLTLSASFEEPKELLGASAGVFGLVGALIVFELVGAAFKRTRLFNRRVLTLAVLVLAQLVFDWFTPIVSSFLHLAGIASGAIAALPLAIWNFRPASSRHDEVSASKKGTARLLGKL